MEQSQRRLLGLARQLEPNGLPGPGDDVIINDLNAGAAVTISSNVESVNSITATGLLDISGGGLTVAANSTISGGLTMTGGSLTTSGSEVTMSVTGTTTISGVSLKAQNGATLSLADLTSYTSTANFATSTFQASGANSVLSLPELASIAAQATYPLQVQVQASSGGEVSMPMLSQISACLQVQSTGAGSVIDLSALQDFSSQLNVYGDPGTFTVTDQGTSWTPC